MDCVNCGAPLVVQGDGDWFRCEYCGSVRFPAESADGVRILGLAEPGADCTVCYQPLSRASIDGCAGLYCGQCGGVLLDQSLFRQIVARHRARARGPADAPKPMDRDQLRRQIHCPQCGRVMDAHPYFGPGNIVIDRCSRCNRVWLDHGELRTIINAPGRDRLESSARQRED
jgi:Zn-finger nucleic acid-binding protein